MRIISPAFLSNTEIPQEYTCDGDGINPPLAISEVPSETKSLALIVDDPDAPAGNFTHWVVWNINPSIDEVNEGEIPEGGKEGINDVGERGYAPPCPPSGTHHYFFRLYALDTILDISPSSTRDELEEAMSGHIISQAELIGLYSQTGDGDVDEDLGEV